MDPADLHLLPASQAALALRQGLLGSEQLVAACLARARGEEATGKELAFLDPEHALAQARAADARRLAGEHTGPLHGVPVAVEDVFDTADMPTENGSVLCAGRTPARDAAVVARLRASGAVILGKTSTAEFGADGLPQAAGPEAVPGGRSGASAAAVAAGLAPLALGHQSAGGTICGAALSGVVGFKPTHGLVSRHGMLTLSRTLDHVGLLSRTIDDLALLAAELAGHDERDPDTRPRARVPFAEVASEDPPIAPRLAFVPTAHGERVDAETREAFEELLGHLGDHAEALELLPSAAAAWGWHRTILEAETAASLDREWEGRERMSGALRARLERGRQLPALEYQRALAAIPRLRESFAELFEQRYDAILTFSTPGAAVEGAASPDDPVFAAPWTLCGMPAVTLPLLQAVDGAFIGVQLVGPCGGDARLLRTARWLSARASSG
ncbi:MAG TPA: amidase [Anaeromyxobacteraceae bacterium]|nr:amidase [Anaeromyxobacteraceae bacterium]